MKKLLVLLASLAALAAAAQPARYAIDPERISVSGISSGGYMAVQLGVAYSGLFRGVGVIAAGPYGCAHTGQGLGANVTRALGPCMAGHYEWAQRWWCLVGVSRCPGANGPDAAASIAHARRRAAEGAIDPLDGLARQRVFLLSGAEDETVDAAVVDALQAFYEALGPAARVQRVRRAGQAHTFPTLDYPAGNRCARAEPPFVSDCDFDGAGTLLAHLHGAPAVSPSGPAPEAAEFDQRPFLPAGTRHGLAEAGYLYVPPACSGAGAAPCGLHVALHGCRQEAADVGRAFVDGAGYNRWAAALRLVVLYPQVRRTAGAYSANPRGCWDWWGYTGDGWDGKRAVQMRAIVAMVEALRAPPP